MRLSRVLVLLICLHCPLWAVCSRDYYYTRTREDPNHLRVSEEYKNQFVNEHKYESRINGTKYEYYKKSSIAMSHDEIVFEIIDKIFRHRLSPFYIHHYDNDDDKKRSSDLNKVSPEVCARDLLYLVDKLPKRSHLLRDHQNVKSNQDEEYTTPELTAFFDSYARQEAGLLMGNTFWVGAYDQCVNRHIFDLTDAQDQFGFKQRTTISTVGIPGGTSKDQDQNVVSFRGRYCVSSLKSPIWDNKIKNKRDIARNYFKSERQFQDYSKLFRIQVGICLPDSCDSNSMERHSDEIKLLTTAMLEPRYADYDLVDLYCLPDESSPMRQWSSSAINFGIFVAVWLVAIALATIADLFEFVDTMAEDKSCSRTVEASTSKRPTLTHLLVCWFSLRANYMKLMRINDEDNEKRRQQREHSHLEKSSKLIEHDESALKKDEEVRKDKLGSNRDDKFERDTNTSERNKTEPEKEQQLQLNLKFLNAFKVMIMFWIINGHIMLLMIQTAKNILNSDALLNGLMHFLIGATFGVDLFFTMTGFLTSYLLFNSGHAYKMKIPTWLYLSFHRYWRLAPMYLITFWFSRSVIQYMGSGPLWDYGTSSLTFRGLCNHESWWYPLTLTSNLHGLFEECMITSWYISCDMQFWLVSPIYIYLLAKSPVNGWLVSLATIFASSKVRYDSILTDKSARYDELVQPRADIFMRVSHDLPALYTHPHFRISPYIVGLLTGHYVYMVKTGQWKSILLYQVRQQQQNACSSSNEANLVSGSEQSSEIEESKPSKRGCPENEKAKCQRIRNTLAYAGLFLFFVMSFVSYLLSHYFPAALLEHAKTIAALAYSIDHLVMSIGASFIIIVMCFGQWSKFVKFLSHPHWTRLSKINYALLLLQCEAIYFQIFRYEQMPVAGTRELINILFNLLVTLYPLAFLVTLVFEFPLANIEKLLLKV